MGKTLGPGSFCAYGPKSEHAITGSTGARLAYLFPTPGVLEAAAPRILGQDFALRSSDNFVRSTQPLAIERLRDLLEDFWSASKRIPEALSYANVVLNIEYALTQTVLAAFASEHSSERKTGRRPVARTAVLGAIDDILRQHGTQPTYVTDLCAAARVSQPTLYRIGSDLS